ncbi:MAG TPA: CHRD domain-containing protein [Anaerolineales bacterium]
MHTRNRALVSLAPIVILVLALASMAAGGPRRNFRAHLAGRNEVPPVSTNAQGQAIFKLSQDGTSLSFKLIVANIEDVTQAHIHCGAAGVNGPVVVFLYGLGPTVSPDGVLSEGVITQSNVIAADDSAACPDGLADFEELIAKMRSGNTYANVHTIVNPGGEVRGQIR